MKTRMKMDYKKEMEKEKGRMSLEMGKNRNQKNGECYVSRNGKIFLRNRLANLACLRHILSQEFMQVEQELIWKQLMIIKAGFHYFFTTH
jgi:hypothetical protein